MYMYFILTRVLERYGFNANPQIVHVSIASLEQFH